LNTTLSFLFYQKILIFRRDNQNNSSFYSLKSIVTEPQNRFDKLIQKIKFWVTCDRNSGFFFLGYTPHFNQDLGRGHTKIIKFDPSQISMLLERMQCF
jgi:hypothetical protein